MKTDVIVMGGGIAGMTTACRTVQLGGSVMVLEKGADLNYPCNSRFTGGVLHVVIAIPLRTRPCYARRLRFCRPVPIWRSNGVCAPWPGISNPLHRKENEQPFITATSPGCAAQSFVAADDLRWGNHCSLL
ncbi:FAD-dependent oxidoreductase [Sinorhizobium medicae]|uniref:FAD-dependent oxidoreductase n=1 Tax=Sinorhizobium medicae TaxID=110321 RepID=UPI000FD6D21A|nr:FAD-dependent oxidoreductase [Sinorhizobium medicae]